MMAFLTVVTALAAQAQDVLYYGNYLGTGTLTNYGTNKAETYDLALAVNNPALVGKEILGLRIPVNTAAKNVADFEAWLTTKLAVVDKKAVKDIATKTFTPSGAWTDVLFDEPYVIGPEGLYAGYTFTVTTVEPASSTDPNKTPARFVGVETPGGQMIHTARTYRKWAAVTGKGSTAMLLILGGDEVKANSAGFTDVDQNLYAQAKQQVNVTLTLANRGTKAISSITYDTEINGKTVSRTRRFSPQLAGGYYGRTTTFQTTIPGQDENGTYPVTFTVTKVNGEENPDLAPSVKTTLAVVGAAPKHRPLVEEYTGTWCGWCPRGLVAMELMREKYPDDFVGVAYHNGDPMTIMDIYPNDVQGYPHLYLDRVVHGDPYNGTAGSPFGIQNDWKSRREVQAPADISVTAEWADEAQTRLKATSSTIFIRDFDENPYQLAYILVADDLHKAAASWGQANYFSGNADYKSDANLAYLTDLPGKIFDLHFNDVAIMHSSYANQAISGSLPTSVKANVANSHSYEFDITKAVGHSGEYLVQDKSKLRVIVALIDTTTGEVVNANKGDVGGTSGIEPATAWPEEAAAAQPAYDLQGRRVSNPTGKGIYIVGGQKRVVR